MERSATESVPSFALQDMPSSLTEGLGAVWRVHRSSPSSERAAPFPERPRASVLPPRPSSDGSLWPHEVLATMARAHEALRAGQVVVNVLAVPDDTFSAHEGTEADLPSVSAARAAELEDAASLVVASGPLASPQVSPEHFVSNTRSGEASGRSTTSPQAPEA